jgi:hypothetical protein
MAATDATDAFVAVDATDATDAPAAVDAADATDAPVAATANDADILAEDILDEVWFLVEIIRIVSGIFRAKSHYARDAAESAAILAYAPFPAHIRSDVVDAAPFGIEFDGNHAYSQAALARRNAVYLADASRDAAAASRKANARADASCAAAARALDMIMTYHDDAGNKHANFDNLLDTCATEISMFISETDYDEFIHESTHCSYFQELDNFLDVTPIEIRKILAIKMMEKMDSRTKLIVFGLINCNDRCRSEIPSMISLNIPDYFPKDCFDFCEKFGIDREHYKMPDALKDGFNREMHNSTKYQQIDGYDTIRYHYDY